MRNRLTFAVIALAGTAGLTLSATGAMASPAPAPEPGAHTITYQIPRPAKSAADRQGVLKAARIIRTAVENGANSGYGNIVVTDTALHLFWKGTPPASLNPALAEAREHATVEIRPAAYSRAELESQVEIISRHIEANMNGPVIGVGVVPDSSGLIVLIRKDADRNNLGLPPVNVPYTLEERDVPTLTSGPAIGPPFHAGEAITNFDGIQPRTCTSGFPVTKNNQTYLLTAGHCAEVGDEFQQNGQVVGTVSEKNAGHDLLLIDAAAEAYIHPDLPVGDWSYAYFGDVVTTRGAMSGQISNLQVTGNIYTAVIPNSRGEATTVHNLMEAAPLNGQPPVTHGDSGAPIYTPTGSKATAVGSVSAVTGTKLLFQPVSTAITDFGVSVLTQ
ncbi:hypothetical protein C1I98_10175 [Spongiactinospora gelatinilytica]|uniref:Peptidase S1 domain-containing protein n=1 Tax=Spongiactinospora gelatinilytica TaxID=2666298 RepID=A0A2W2GQ09_9ACTN|nr:hypothetical protein [Spongiactinospora gelatinilytica]PZG50591.1 hypothetical protein C1I98_10175 [Spongiactinospora gelatinilytica]